MKNRSRMFEFDYECCTECKYGCDDSVCHGNSDACGECPNGRYEKNLWRGVYEYCCACCDSATDEEIEKGRCKYFVDKHQEVDGKAT